MDANVLNDHLNSCKKKLLTQSKLDDSHKIQIESVDSSLKDVWLHDEALWLVPVVVVDRISMMFQSFMTTVTL